MLLLDSPLHIQNQSGGWDPSTAPDFAAMGLVRLPRAYEFDLTTGEDTIKANLSAALGADKAGNLVINGEFFSADDPASLDVRRVEQFAKDLDLFRSLTPQGTKLWWFGGPVIGNSLTDPAEVLKTHMADAAFMAHGIGKKIDGIAWAVYTSAKGKLSDLFTQVKAGLALAADFNLPVMLYLSHFDFSTPHDRLPAWLWGAYLQLARELLDANLAQQVAWYAIPADITTPKWDSAIDQPYLDALKSLLS